MAQQVRKRCAEGRVTIKSESSIRILLKLVRRHASSLSTAGTPGKIGCVRCGTTPSRCKGAHAAAVMRSRTCGDNRSTKSRRHNSTRRTERTSTTRRLSYEQVGPLQLWGCIHWAITTSAQHLACTDLHRITSITLTCAIKDPCRAVNVLLLLVCMVSRLAYAVPSLQAASMLQWKSTHSFGFIEREFIWFWMSIPMMSHACQMSQFSAF